MGKIVKISVDFGSTNSAVGTMEYLVDEDGVRTPNVSSVRLCSPYPPLYAIPTAIVYKDENSDNDNITRDMFGRETIQKFHGRQLISHTNFKKALFDEHAPGYEEAKKCTVDYFRFLKESVFPPFDSSAKYETSLSMPVRRTPADALLMKELATQAGFPGEISIADEAECAFRYALGSEDSQLKKLIEELTVHQTLNVLMLDIGGSTADIMLFRLSFTPEGAIIYENISSWPPVGEKNTLGGYCVDELLHSYMMDNGLLNEELVKASIENAGLLCFREFKEEINNRLRNGKTVKGLSLLTELAYYKRLAPERDFESCEDAWITPERYTDEICAPYIGELIRAIRATIANTRESGAFQEKDIDAVVVGGGGSNLYFIRDILLGELSAGEEPLSLTKIQQNPERIIQPQMPPLAPKSDEYLYDPSMMCVLGNLFESPSLCFRNSSNADYMVTVEVYQFKPSGLSEFRAACEDGSCRELCGEPVATMELKVAELREPLPTEHSIAEKLPIVRDTKTNLYYILRFMRSEPDGQITVLKCYSDYSVRTPGKLLADWFNESVMGETVDRFESVTLELACSSSMSEAGKVKVNFSMDTEHVFKESPSIDFDIG